MTMNMKKTLTTLLAATMMTAMFASCGATESTESTATEETTTEETSTEETTEEATETESTLPDAAISVCSREDGSGTRGAFIELFGIEEKDEEGNKVDKTTTAAEITNSTAVMMSTIAGNEYGIGYISLGSLDDSVKALKVDGVEATAENIENGSYTVQRPFNIVTSETVSDAAQDFINFIMSDEGQAVVSEEGYIPVESTGAYEASVSESDHRRFFLGYPGHGKTQRSLSRSEPEHGTGSFAERLDHRYHLGCRRCCGYRHGFPCTG